MLDIQSGSGVGFEDVRRFGYLVEPELSPKTIVRRLNKLLGRVLTEKEAQVAWDEIMKYKAQRLSETGEDIPVDQAVQEWDEKYGYAFHRRWFLTRPEPSKLRYIPGARERDPGPLDKVAGRAVPELQPLLEAGFGVQDVISAAKSKPGKVVRFLLRRVPKQKRDKYYVQLVARMTGWTLSPEEAERVWEQVLTHKLYLSERAGHDVPIERAVVDFFKRLRLSGLDRAALWETGNLFVSDATGAPEDAPNSRSTEPGTLFPA